jgi:hypothetical protein
MQVISPTFATSASDLFHAATNFRLEALLVMLSSFENVYLHESNLWS